MEGKDYIVAIDFGSSRAGSVFAKKTSDEKKIDIKECNFKDTGASIKTLNEVILNDSNEIISYGFAVNKYIKDGKLKESEALYRRIKMNLYKNLSEIESFNSNKSIDLEELIAIILEHLKKHSIKSILENEGKKNKDNIDYDRESSKIRWVLTIPAIWDEKNKYIMMKAAEKAGIVDEKNKTLFFALEPEAASYYCLKEKDSSIKDDIFKKPYIVCDLGGGTADIVCHERITEDGIEKIIEKCAPKGGPFGSDEINKEFEDKVLKLLFGEDIFETIKKKFEESLKGNQSDKNLAIISKKYIKLIDDINLYKEGLTDDLNESMSIDCSIFFKNFENLDMEKIVENYNKKCNPEWKITEYGMDEMDRSIVFPCKIIYDLTKNLTDKISNLLLEVLSEVKEASTILYVGGFSSSKVAIELIKSKINEKYKNIQHKFPNNPQNAVLKGAIYYGLSPKRIKSRKAKYTLGMNAYFEWDEKKHGKKGKKGFDPITKKDVCENAFYSFISKNENIPYDNCITRPLALRFDRQDGTFGGHLVLYKSNNPNVIFIDEEGVEEIGKLDLTIYDGRDYTGGNFLVTIELGGTFLNVTAFHRESNTSSSMEFEY